MNDVVDIKEKLAYFDDFVVDQRLNPDLFWPDRYST
jgi:hypothetical protein